MCPADLHFLGFFLSYWLSGKGGLQGFLDLHRGGSETVEVSINHGVQFSDYITKLRKRIVL